MTKLPKMIQALLDPLTYPEPPGKIEMSQTQMSFVFLTDKYVYKVKKPVNLGFLDYTTLDNRQLYCRKEVELNQRLCPDTYLGVVSITRNTDGIRIEGKGETLEYAVKMRRLPQDRMLDIMLIGNQVPSDMMVKIARKVAQFHNKAATGAAISAFGDLDTVKFNTQENFSQTEKYFDVTITKTRFERIKAYTESFIENNTNLFHQRVENGRIRDCHGDLHAAHICLTDDICIYDCIEFNDRFRYCDVASEIAFLAMDLDHYNRADLSRAFVSAYIKASKDKEIEKLLNFYKCYRAYVRGKVNSFKLDDPHVSDEEKKEVLKIASSYFELAESYVS